MVHEQIKQVGWGNLESNLEDSSVLEEMFLQLFNYDQIDQEIVLEDILSAIYQDGTSFEVTPIAIHFLLLFAKQTQSENIFTILSILAQIMRDIDEIDSTQKIEMYMQKTCIRRLLRVFLSIACG